MTSIQTMILEKYFPIIKIDLNTEDYAEVSAVTNEEVLFTAFSQRYFNFAQEILFPTDAQDFLQFMNIYNNIKYFDKNPKGKKVCYYRQLTNDKEYHWVHAGLHPDVNYSKNNRIVYLIAKDAGGEPRIDKILANAKNELNTSVDFETQLASYRKTFPASIGLIIIETKDASIKDTLSISHGGEHCYQYPEPDKYAVLLEDLTPEDFSDDLMDLFSFLRGYEEYSIGTCWCDDEDLGIDYMLQVANEKLKKSVIIQKGGNEDELD